MLPNNKSRTHLRKTTWIYWFPPGISRTLARGWDSRATQGLWFSIIYEHWKVDQPSPFSNSCETPCLSIFCKCFSLFRVLGKHTCKPSHNKLKQSRPKNLLILGAWETRKAPAFMIRKCALSLRKTCSIKDKFSLVPSKSRTWWGLRQQAESLWLAQITTKQAAWTKVKWEINCPRVPRVHLKCRNSSGGLCCTVFCSCSPFLWATAVSFDKFVGRGHAQKSESTCFDFQTEWFVPHVSKLDSNPLVCACPPGHLLASSTKTHV